MPSRKKATKKSRPAKKKTVRKKAATKKKPIQKKTTRKKKVVKKAVVRKKITSRKKTTAKKKKVAATRKKVTKKTTRKKTTAKKKKVAAARKKVAKKTTRKKTTAKKKKVAAARKKVAKKTRKKTTKSNITKLKTKPRKSTQATTESTKIKPYKKKSGEEYMSPEQVTHFHEILSNWKKELMEEVDRTVHHMQDDASNFPDPNDRATQEEEFALELRTRDRERKLIIKIDESLMDLDNGDYGYCEVCGIEIGIRRLEARPTAALCIDCKTLDEIKERQLG
jgi:DnaK suppressor protein